MHGKGPDENVDHVANALRALGHPVRMTILRELRSPKTITEIRVVGGPRRRTLARQTVKEHVDRLVEAGLVATHESERPYGETTEYCLNHQSLYLLLESVKDMVAQRPEREPSGDTVPSGLLHAKVTVTRPSLVVVKGLAEGYAFPLLPPASAPSASWTIGRRRGLPVSLDFDPTVSKENSLVRWEDDAYTIEDLPTSRNGTFLNFEALEPGQAVDLSHGDLVGVGRSILMFRH